MTRRRWMLVTALGLFAVVTIYLAARPHTWQGSLEVPAGVPNQTRTYHCASILSSAYVHGPNPSTLPYRLIGTPCGERSQLQVMSVIDLIVAVTGIGIVLTWHRRSGDDSGDRTLASVTAGP